VISRRSQGTPSVAIAAADVLGAGQRRERSVRIARVCLAELAPNLDSEYQRHCVAYTFRIVFP
jgi:hypothetical protein